MYLPYLRGKQNELIALRDYADCWSEQEQVVLPIIEPVKCTGKSLETTMIYLKEKSMKFALIINPKDGDFKKIDFDLTTLYPFLMEASYNNNWIPTLLYHNNGAQLKDLMNKLDLHEVMIIFKEGYNDKNQDMQDLTRLERVEYIVDGDANSRSHKILQRHCNKNLIRLDSKFIDQKRNADYEETPDEPFTEEPYYYMEDNLWGFSDYTALSQYYIEGGMLPSALAIHLTYENENQEIYIHHFISDNKEGLGDIQGKFREAALKVEVFFRNQDKTRAVNELIEFLNPPHYPGLGVLKKIAVANHLELITNILNRH
jgi:hypothetical protein